MNQELEECYGNDLLEFWPVSHLHSSVEGIHVHMDTDSSQIPGLFQLGNQQIHLEPTKNQLLPTKTKF